MTKPQLIRFVVHRKHWRSGERCGLFHAIDEVLGADDPPTHFRAAMLEISSWFDTHLKTPFLDPDIPGGQGERKIEPQDRSISWIRTDAVEHVTKLFHLKAIIEEAGWLVDELRTTKPGTVLYEDEHQVIAIPYADTPT